MDVNEFLTLCINGIQLRLYLPLYLSYLDSKYYGLEFYLTFMACTLNVLAIFKKLFILLWIAFMQPGISFQEMNNADSLVYLAETFLMLYFCFVYIPTAVKVIVITALPHKRNKF